MLYRVFPHEPGTRPDPMAVPRDLQGGGRHDNPDQYTAIYLAREPIAAVAERIQAFRGRALTGNAFHRPDGRLLTLGSIDDGAWPTLVDLDDPDTLASHGIRPSRVATAFRETTQRLALDFFSAGAVGLSWWSTLEAMWTNVTVFRERLDEPFTASSAEPLDLDHPVVREAAAFLGVELGGR